MGALVLPLPCPLSLGDYLPCCPTGAHRTPAVLSPALQALGGWHFLHLPGTGGLRSPADCLIPTSTSAKSPFANIS